jgi:ABC-type sugar transport system ATPase subunit
MKPGETGHGEQQVVQLESERECHRTAVISARGLTKIYTTVCAAQNVSFDLYAGSVVGLLGKNGAGKSTVIKLLTGVEHPDDGSLEVNGESVSLRSARDSQKRGIAAVYQERIVTEDLTVAEAVLLGLGYPKSRIPIFISMRRIRQRAQAILGELGVDASHIDVSERVGSLSIALQRSVLIARAIAAESKIIILDEPTASLTAPEIDALHALLRRLRDRGVAVVYVSHRIDEVMAICDRFIVMSDGRVIGSGEVDEVSRQDLIELITGNTSGSDRVSCARSKRTSSTASEALRAENVTDGSAVKTATMMVRKGEVVGLAGLVGSGRTEFLNIIAGVSRLASGSMFLNGTPYHPRSPSEALHKGVILLPEDRRSQGLFESFSIRENIVLPTLPSVRAIGWLPFPSRRRENERTEEVVREMSISVTDTEQSVLHLSGGNQQKLIIGRWLSSGGSLFLFDEPTVGIDVAGKAEIQSRIRSLVGPEKSALVVSSEFEELPGLCDRIYVMNGGIITEEFDGQSVTSADLVSACFAVGSGAQR